MKISKYIEKAFLTVSRQNTDLFQRPQRTYFTFVLDKTYAVPSEDIQELIPYPQSAYSKSMFHHRGETVIIVDTKAMLVSPDQADSVSKNLMVFHKNKINFALMIDSFKVFISSGHEDHIKISSQSNLARLGGTHEDDMEKLIIRDESGDFKILHLLNLDSIARKISAEL